MFSAAYLSAGSWNRRTSVQPKAMTYSLTFRLRRYMSGPAERLNFTRAVGQVLVSQSSLSHQVGRLEDSIDVVIFERLQNGLKLTAADRVVVAYAENTLRDWEQAVSIEVLPLRGRNIGLTLGVSTKASPPPTTPAFCLTYCCGSYEQ